MKLIRAFQEGYGKVYGLLVFAAYTYFIALGIFWFYQNEVSHQFNIIPLVFTLVFLVLMYFRNKLANLIVGVIGLFLSIISLLRVIASYNDYKAAGTADKHLIMVVIGICILNILMFILLIFSFLKGFLQQVDE